MDLSRGGCWHLAGCGGLAGHVVQRGGETVEPGKECVVQVGLGGVAAHPAQAPAALGTQFVQTCRCTGQDSEVVLFGQTEQGLAVAVEGERAGPGDGEAGGGGGHLLRDHEVVVESGPGCRIEPDPGTEGNRRREARLVLGLPARLWIRAVDAALGELLFRRGQAGRGTEPRWTPVPRTGAPGSAEHGADDLRPVGQQPLGTGPHEAFEGGGGHWCIPVDGGMGGAVGVSGADSEGAVEGECHDHEVGHHRAMRRA